jgi:hypothetical protein
MTTQTPSVGRIVHYVSYGTPGAEYTSECRAAIVTGVGDLIGTHPSVEHSSDEQALSLCVLNPEGMFFNRGVIYHDGAEHPGAHDCPSAESHGHPFRYCTCGWHEAARKGGTWHWPERTS